MWICEDSLRASSHYSYSFSIISFTHQLQSSAFHISVFNPNLQLSFQLRSPAGTFNFQLSTFFRALLARLSEVRALPACQSKVRALLARLSEVRAFARLPEQELPPSHYKGKQFIGNHQMISGLFSRKQSNIFKSFTNNPGRHYQHFQSFRKRLRQQSTKPYETIP